MASAPGASNFMSPNGTNTLNIRTRDLPASNATNNHANIGALGQKRKSSYIDLTDDNDVTFPSRSPSASPSTYKRSRSSSDSPQENTGTSIFKSNRKTSPHFRTTKLKTLSGGHEQFRSRLDVTKNKGVVHAISAVRISVRPKPVPTNQEKEKRRHFLQNLSTLKGVSLRNDIDNDSPPIDFTFAKESVLGEGVFRATEDIMVGCGCFRRHSQQNGCVYLDSCTCIEDSAMDEDGRKYFAYGASASNHGLLRKKVLHTRNHIYECNSKCDCNVNCRNRVVQHGRQIKVEIFKTPDRGWGLKPLENLRQGQFIDTYRGEIITSEEADLRGQSLTEEETDNFFFDFDKFKFEQPEAYDPERAYVCDGRHYGSPARFLNHSCDPNCAIYTVSYNHNDRNIYELAFFALEDIEKGTELTFDYYDNDENMVISDENALKFEREKGYKPTRCLCGSKECRGYFLH